jgi:hypothetical protein
MLAELFLLLWTENVVLKLQLQKFKQPKNYTKTQGEMKITIGRSDKADFPELSLFDIDLKVDSGAYTFSVLTKHLL